MAIGPHGAGSIGYDGLMTIRPDGKLYVQSGIGNLGTHSVIDIARVAADVLAMLDMTAWISVLGLLDECPILPVALTAILERRTTSVSPAAFDFISTTAQIGNIRLFMRKLPGVLSR